MRLFVSIVSTLLGIVSASGVPETINIQGNLSTTNGNPVTGTRAYRVQFFDSEVNGSSLGGEIDGTVTLSEAGRFSIDLVPPSQVFGTLEVFYSLGIDSGNPPDGNVDTSDFFPQRVKVNSVLFAREAEEAETALGLSGPLTAPGDRIPLGTDVFLQVGPDGEVELLANGRRLRLAGQKWTDPSSLFDNISPDDFPGSNPQVAINSKGETLIAWVQSNGSGDRIFRSHYRNGAWIDPTSITDHLGPNSDIASDPVVAISDNGDALICWRLFDGSIRRILRSHFHNGVWTEDFVSVDGSEASVPQIEMNAAGEAVIVWEQFDGLVSRIFRSEFRNGSWDDPMFFSDFIGPGELTSAHNPRVALNDNGEAVIVWDQSDGSNGQIFRSEYREGAWTVPADLPDNISPDGTGASVPRVALNNDGEAVIVWTQISDAEKIEVFRSEYRDGAWIDPADLSDNISPDGQPTMDPQVAIADNGDAVIVWTQSDGMQSQIFRSENRNGSWDDPADLLDNISPNGSTAQTPQVRMNGGAESLIVWAQSDGANQQLFRSHYLSGAWIDPATLEDNFTPDGASVLEFQAALNGVGDAVVAWQQFDGGRNQIFRSEFRGGVWVDPISLSDNISPNQTPTDPPQMALSDKGDTVIVWRQSDNTRVQIYRSEFRFGF